MEIVYPQELIPFLKNKHLLLDTNIFRDSPAQPTLFNKFFTTLKTNGVTLVTSDFVKYELLKGSANDTKYCEKEAFIQSIAEAIIPTTSNEINIAYSLIKEYTLDGAGVSITDLLLGALLKHYKEHMYLLSRDTSAFISRIFKLVSIINCPLSKGIFTYGVYGYSDTH